jgi:hypothetical protein
LRSELDVVFAERVEDAWREALMPEEDAAASARAKPRRESAPAKGAEGRRAIR